MICSATCGSKVHIVCSPASCRSLRYSFERLELPGFRALVVLPHTPIELAGDAADRLLVADVGGAQPAAGQSAQMFAGLDQQRRLPHPLHLDGGRDAGRRATVDDDVGHFRVCDARDEQQAKPSR